MRRLLIGKMSVAMFGQAGGLRAARLRWRDSLLADDVVVVSCTQNFECRFVRNSAEALDVLLNADEERVVDTTARKRADVLVYDMFSPSC